MLALVAARYLSRVVGVKVEELYYGALEMTTPEGETPVLRLGGLLAMLDWVDALATYDKDGDYGVFAPLLAADGMDKGRADLLTRAAYFERTGNPVRARETLSTVFPSVEAHRGSLGSLFSETLKKRISWFRRGKRDDWELSLADAYRERGDYLRAATFMYEAFVTRACNERSDDPTDFELRKKNYASARGRITPAPERNSLKWPSSNTCATPSPTVSDRAPIRKPAPSTTKAACAARSSRCATSFSSRNPEILPP